MNYSTTQQQQPQQQQPKSARAASKAPLYSQQQQQQQQQQQNRHPSPPTSNASAGTKARQSGANSGPTSAQKGKANANKIWSTSTIEERERIKDFWLGLGEPERRNLVKIEKDTVLRKMKEQQKHSCSCAVCGRKRSVSLSIFLYYALFLTHELFFFYMSILFCLDHKSDHLTIVLPSIGMQ